MKRLGTAAVAVPVVLTATFLLPSWAFFLACALLIGLACLEFVVLARSWAPGAPLSLIPPCGLLFAAGLSLPGILTEVPGLGVMVGALALSVGVGLAALLGRTPVEQAPAAVGALGFGTLYFALPVASMTQLQRLDPWLVFLLFAIVWLGDTAAYWVGTRWGRHRMAPVVSPKKTWEGAAAGLAIGLAATLVWSLARLGRVELSILALGAATAVAAQLGDLVESVFKRSAGVKDSGRLLPGHGGFLDRADALLFAAPVLWVGLLSLGVELALP